jgi:DegV family protein with EDD domain
MNIKITSDSTCDLSQELVEQYNIGMIPIKIEKGGKTFRDGIDIFPDDIFSHVDAGGEICKTAAVNPTEYQSFFEQLSHRYEAVIHINLGSGFSSCYQNACEAGEEFSNVFVVDSNNLSSGQGHVVLEAAMKAREGCSVKDILEHLADIIPRVRSSFLLNRLDYMAKGGRCTMIRALGADLLRLKPCIEVADGKMIVGKKYRGSLKRCLAQYAEDKLGHTDKIATDRIFVTHTTINPEILEMVKDIVAKKELFDNRYETIAGCTVSCHCGQNTLGILYIEK